jgi:Fur family transcriptional regulator, ferric uptake regulator
MEKNCCHTPLNEDTAKELLGQYKINRTKTKIRILLEISRSKKPLSVQDLYLKLKKSCDVSTIFRTVSQFKDKNILHEVNLDEGFVRYEMATLDHKDQIHHHHHHVRCRSCGDIQQIEHCDLKAFEKAITKMGFTRMEHRLEFSGLCQKCS